MKKAGLVVILSFAVFMTPAVLIGQNNEPNNKISIDTLLWIQTVVGGWRTPSPKWSPDGKQIIFWSLLNGGGPVVISAEGGFPWRLPIKGSDPGFSPNIVQNDPRFSPDGKWVSYISEKTGATEIWLWSVRETRDVQLTKLGCRIRSMNWSPDGRWIALSADLYGGFDIWRVAVPGGQAFRLTSDKRDELNPVWTPDSNRIVFVQADERAIDHDIFQITAEGGSRQLIVSDKDFFDEGGSTLGYPFVSPDGKNVLFRSWRSGWINYWAVPLNGGEPRQIAPENSDQNDASWSPDGKSIVYTSNHNGTYDLRVVSVAGGKPKVLMAPEMGVCEDPEWSPDGSRISFVLTTSTRPKDLYIVSLKSGEIKQLTDSMPPGNLEKNLVRPEKITYPSADGLIINAYLYKPSNIPSGKRLPAIVWIHGGPTGQFEEMFHHQNQSGEACLQVFVQNGYVILQPNIRGSSGYGKEFEKANNQCWGECDLNDVIAGAEYLKSLPFVNPQKLVVAGRSYGGMLTMAAVTNVPGYFQAAITESGHEDWTEDSKSYDYELGPLKENYELRWKLSPVNHVENVVTPIMVIHGEGRGPASPSSKLFVEQLRKHNKVYRYKVYRDEGYYVHGLENQRQMLLDKLEFLDQYLSDRIVANINALNIVTFWDDL